MAVNIITISREFGSGGRTIGKKLSERLGIPCYDSEIIDKVAEESEFDKKYIADRGEYVHAPISSIFSGKYYHQNSNEDIIWAIQSKIIKELADKGPCVIVGRCADFLLRDRDDLLKVFICSDKKSRAERIVSVYGENDESPEKRIKNKDRRRAVYYQFYTDMKWGNARNYDISLNSGTLGIDGCVEILYNICKNQ